MTDKNWSEADFAEEMRRIQEEIERAVSDVEDAPEEMLADAEDLFEEIDMKDFEEVEIEEDGYEKALEAVLQEEVFADLEEVNPEEVYYEEEEVEEVEEEPKKGGFFTKKRRIILLASLLGVLAVAGVAFFIFFQNKVKFYEDHFFAGTYINGVNFSDRTPEEVEKELLSRIDEYVLKIKTREGDTVQLAGKDIKLTPEFDIDFQELLDQQNPKDWLKAKGDTFEYETKAMWSYDEALLKEWFDQEPYFDETTKIENVEMKLMWESELKAWEEEQNKDESEEPEEPVQPEVPAEPETPVDPEAPADPEAPTEEVPVVLPEADSYVVRQPVQGNRMDMEAAYDEVKKAIGSLAEELPLAETDCYIDDMIEMDTTKLQAQADKLNQYAKALIIYDMGEGIIEYVGIETISKCLTLEDNGEVTFDPKPLEEYVTYIQDKYDTYGKPRTVTTWNGRTITVSGGTYGWQLNWQKTYDALVKYVKAGENVMTEPIYKQEAASHGPNDYGTTYVELDMDNQVVKFFVNGELKRSAKCVTGMVYSWRDLTTPRGTYSILEMLSPKTMTGQIMEDGEPEYVTDCKYWMRVTWTGIGFHDATWQPWFGGDRYLYNGSHGCINLSYSDAQYFYNNFYIGLPVIAYGGRNAVFVPKPEEPTTEEATTEAPTTEAPTTEAPVQPTTPPVTPTDPPMPPQTTETPTVPPTPPTESQTTVAPPTEVTPTDPPTPETDPTVSGEGQVASE